MTLFEDTGIELEFERDAVERGLAFDSPDDAVEFYTTRFGPLIKARELTEAEGRWPALRDDLAAYFAREEPAEYLLVLGRKT